MIPETIYKQSEADGAERAVLASMYAYPDDALPAAVAILSKEDFNSDVNRWVFTLLRALQQTVGISEHTLRDETIRANTQGFGWIDVLHVVTEIPLSGKALEATIGLVKEASKKRAIRAACQTALEAIQQRTNSQEIAGKLTASVSNLAVRESKRSQPLGVVMLESIDRWDEMAARGEDSFIPTGLYKIDSLVGGILRDVLTVIAAPTSHGKTALALSIAENVGHYEGTHNVVIYSLEMSKSLVTRRVCARSTRIPMDRLMHWRRLSDEDKQSCRNVARDFDESKVYFASRCRTLAEILADARMRVSEGKLDLMVVDYLQLVDHADESNREREVNQVAWKLFDLANEMSIAVVALSQVLDNCQQRKSGRLALDDLRDAKAIGHHARAVWMFQRPWQWTKGVTGMVPECKALLQIEKQGEGKTGDVELHFDGEMQEFSDQPTNRCNHCGR